MDEVKLVALVVEAVEGGEARDRARAYSGRGMYGRDCLGVVTSNPYRMLLEVAAALNGLADEADDPVAALAGYPVCSDSMGREVVVYWPDLPPPPADEDEDEEVA